MGSAAVKNEVTRVSIDSLYSMPVDLREFLDDSRELTNERHSRASA
jgi:hypothetical protein